jgi:Tfp pilus assembly protein PilW
VNWRDDSGLSFTELLVVSSLMVVVLGAVWSVMYSVSSMNDAVSARAVATDESQVFLDRLGLELRQADSQKNLAGVSTSDAAAQGAFAEILPRQVTFYGDLYHNRRPVRVQYYMSGTSLHRKEWASTNTTYPYTWSTNTTDTVVIASVDPAWAGAVFSYYTDDNWPPTQITDASQIASVTAVIAQVHNLQRWGGRSQSYDASMTIRVRAIDNKF